MINRNVTKSVPAFSGIGLAYTCSTGDALSGVALNGAIVDRLGLGGSAYPIQVRKDDRALVAAPFAFVFSSAFTTAASRQVVIDCQLQHGDSSGGGDMANLSTQDAATSRTYWTTAHTTDMLNWTTGAQYLHSNVSDYALDGAKRFLRPVTIVTKTYNSTVSDGTDQLKVVQGINFGEFTYAPPTVLSGTTATSTA